MAIIHTKVSAKPDSGDATMIQASDWNAEHSLALWERAALLGTRDGVNNTFTINTSVPAGDIQIEFIIWNGLILRPTVGYIRSGLTITMQSGYIPTGDPSETLESIILYN